MNIPYFILALIVGVVLAQLPVDNQNSQTSINEISIDISGSYGCVGVGACDLKLN